jgi:hypothetical protein
MLHAPLRKSPYVGFGKSERTLRHDGTPLGAPWTLRLRSEVAGAQMLQAVPDDNVGTEESSEQEPNQLQVVAVCHHPQPLILNKLPTSSAS